MTTDTEQMSWHHRRARGFHEWIYGLGEGPFNSKWWAICIMQSDGESRYDITYYRAMYDSGVFQGFLADNWDERIESWPHDIEELKAYAIFEWRTKE